MSVTRSIASDESVRIPDTLVRSDDASTPAEQPSARGQVAVVTVRSLPHSTRVLSATPGG
jgi:hypothetical protein